MRTGRTRTVWNYFLTKVNSFSLSIYAFSFNGRPVQETENCIIFSVFPFCFVLNDIAQANHICTENIELDY